MRGTISATPLRRQPSEDLMTPKMIALWLIVGIPLAFGIEQTLEKVASLFY
jgi:hypothetical protein